MVQWINHVKDLIKVFLQRWPLVKIAGEPVWKKFGYFGQQRSDFNLEKGQFS